MSIVFFVPIGPNVLVVLGASLCSLHSLCESGLHFSLLDAMITIMCNAFVSSFVDATMRNKLICTCGKTI